MIIAQIGNNPLSLPYIPTDARALRGLPNPGMQPKADESEESDEAPGPSAFIPRWVWIAGGLAAAGAIGWGVLRK